MKKEFEKLARRADVMSSIEELISLYPEKQEELSVFIGRFLVLMARADSISTRLEKAGISIDDPRHGDEVMAVLTIFLDAFEEVLKVGERLK